MAKDFGVTPVEDSVTANTPKDFKPKGQKANLVKRLASRNYNGKDKGSSGPYKVGVQAGVAATRG